MNDAEGRLYLRGDLRDSHVWGANFYIDVNNATPAALEALRKPDGVASIVNLLAAIAAQLELIAIADLRITAPTIPNKIIRVGIDVAGVYRAQADWDNKDRS